MATRTHTVSRVQTYGDRAHVLSWAGLLNGDDGTPVEMPGSADRSIQFVGTFGAGGTIVLEGSNDGVNYVTLTDPQGNAISKTAAGIEAVLELTRFVRPRVTAGDGTTDLQAHLLVKRD
jgi:hypothetical protein